jgi:O-antigen/teichoic acid export membrane protein
MTTVARIWGTRHDRAQVIDAEAELDILRTPEAGGRVVRGGLVRGLGYGVGTLLAAGTSVLLLRHLGRDDFGRYGTVAALLGVVSGISDAGLTAVGARELALAARDERPRLLRNLVTLRLAITPVGIVLAALFAFFAYDRTMFWGTLLGGVGVLLVNTQATMMAPLSVELRLGAVTAFEVLKAALTFVVVAALVALGASLLPFLGAQIPVGAAVILLTPLAVPLGRGLLPAFDRDIARSLLREALPLAVALTMNVIYFRVLMIMTSLIASRAQTGLFATSFQVFAVLFSLPLLVLSTALPLLSVAGRDDLERLRFGLQRMTEVAFAAGIVFVLVIVALAPVLVPFLGGSQYRGAAPVLSIQSFALIAVFVGQTWQLGLLSLRRQGALAWANGGSLLAVLGLGAVLIPLYDAKGAAVAALLGETFLAALVYLFLRRAGRDVAPRPGLVPRIAVASAPAWVVLALPLPWEARLVLAPAAFALASAAIGAVPAELVHALRRR